MGCGIRIGECADTKATYILAVRPFFRHRFPNLISLNTVTLAVISQLYQIITSLVVGFRARNRVEAEGFIWILHSNEEIIYSFYSPLCRLPFFALPAPFSIYLQTSTNPPRSVFFPSLTLPIVFLTSFFFPNADLLYLSQNSLQTPIQQHLVTQLVQALSADAECVCLGSSSAVPTVSSLTPAAPSVSLPGPLAKERERGDGSDMGLHDGMEDEERDKGGERECAICALERVQWDMGMRGRKSRWT
jgi:hypothetical protein